MLKLTGEIRTQSLAHTWARAMSIAQSRGMASVLAEVHRHARAMHLDVPRPAAAARSERPGTVNRSR
jgi:hypothetical protein